MHPSAVEKKGQPITIQMVEQRINSEVQIDMLSETHEKATGR